MKAVKDGLRIAPHPLVDDMAIADLQARAQELIAECASVMQSGRPDPWAMLAHVINALAGMNERLERLEWAVYASRFKRQQTGEELDKALSKKWGANG
jgi:hypothetical protein